MIEEWRAIPGYDGRYEVTRTAKVRNALTQQQLQPGVASHGYPTVSLRRGFGPPKTWCLHTLVLSAFVGPRPSGHCCRHLDGNKLNNNLSNLAWGSYAENAADMAVHGTRIRGQKYKSARVSDDSAAEIRALKGVMSQSALAKIYGVSPAAVQAVYDGRTWKHVRSLGVNEAFNLRMEFEDVRAALVREAKRRKTVAA